jgi:D-arabinose 1-dehydrogenase-like Zn-dependent alcohol dehydrogenase
MIARYFPLLAPEGKVFPLTISTEAMQISPLSLIAGSLRVVGSGLASTGSLRAMLNFAAKHGIKPQVEKFPMNKSGVKEAMQKLRDGKMRYRGVLVVE